MELTSLTIHAAAEGLRAKKFSSVELTKACLNRIKSVEPKLKAFVLVTEDIALAQAKKADAEFKKESPKSSLFGIPCTLKDIFCMNGVRTTDCSNILKNFVPAYDATVVKKLKEAGMVFLGKTNTDEFTCGSSTETSCFGSSQNPWDITRTPGGSSGGSASAVAADECFYSLGSDTGGSIRQPASYCGVTGLKVTYGRVSRFGTISMASSLDTIGPIVKDVEDAAIVLNAIAGNDPQDPTTPNVAVPDYTKALNVKDLKGITIGLPKEYFIPGMNAEVEATVREAIKQLEKLGAKVKEISLPHTKYGLSVYYIICPSELSANLERYDGIRFGPGPKEEPKDLFEYYMKSRAEGFGDEIKRRVMVGTYALSAGYYDAYYLKAQKVRTLVKADFEKAFEDVDVIVAPATPDTAFKTGEKDGSDPVQMYLEDVFTITANIAGIPGLSVPCGFSTAGMPIGMQIFGPQFGEPVILKVGSVYQNATDWHTRKPKI